MWAPLAGTLARDYTVVVPDLRGMGLSSHPADGYDKRTQAADVRAVLTHLGIDRAAIVGHDIGTMVAYAYAARYPDKTEKKASMVTKLPMPVLAIGGEKSFGATEAVVMRHAATNVTAVVIPKAGHWLMEEEPAATMTAIRTFLDATH